MMDSREYLNELAADIATEWDLYRNNQLSSLHYKPPLMTGTRYATCALMGESTSPVSHCNAIVLVEGQMPDSFTSNVSLYMQQPRVCDGMEMI